MYSIPVVLQLVLAGVAPSRAGSSGDSVGDATGDAVASVGAAVGLTGAGEEVGPADDDDDAGAVTPSCIAPVGPAVVDEHPATAAVTSTNPTVRSFIRVLIACSNL